MARLGWVTALLVACSACRSTGVQLVGGLPAVTAAPPAQLSGGPSDYVLDFGPVAIGEEASATISLENIGAAPLTISQSAPPTDGAFTLNVGTVTIPGGGQVSVTASYKPAEAGVHTFAVPLQTDSQKIPLVTITLSGDGEKRALTVTPQVIDFGNVVVHTSVSRTLTVTNASAFALTISPTALIGTTSAPFTVVPSDAFTLAGGNSMPMTATYAPLSPSAGDSAQFSLAPNIGPPIAVSLLGAALQSGLSISPLTLDFNYVSPGQRPSLTVHIRNIGNDGVTLLAVILSGTGPDAAPFSIPQGLPSGSTSSEVLAPGAELDVPVTFAPRSVGYFTNKLQITALDLGGTTTVPISGFGGGAAISCSPLALDFGVVGAGVSTALPLVCTNTGLDVPGHPEAGLQIATLPTSSVVFTANLNAAASHAQPLSAGQSVEIDVAYLPTMTERDTGTLTVLSNVQNGSAPPLVQLSGNAVAPGPCHFTLAPTELNWGQVPIDTPATLSYTLTDLGPNDCYLWQLGLSATTDPSFSMMGPDAGTLWLSPPGGAGSYPSSATIPVSLFAQTLGEPTGAVTFHISDPGGPNQSIPLSAVVANSCLTVTPTSLDFGTVGLSNGALCQSERRSVIAHNGCPIEVQVTGVTASAPFAIESLPPLPLRLAAGQSSPPIEIGFTPTTFGEFFTSASVETNMWGTPFDVFLHGKAVDSAQQVDSFVLQPKVDVLWVIDNDDDEWVFDGVQNQMQGPSGASPALTAFLAGGAGVDYQMGVINTETTCGDQGNIEPCAACEVAGDDATLVTPADPDGGLSLSNLIWHTLVFQGINSCNDALGTGDQIDEQLVRAAYLAMQPGLLASHNRAFLRPDARLEVIFVNWDPEEIDNSENNPLTYPGYLSFFQSLKQMSSLVAFDYVGPGMPLPPFNPGTALDLVAQTGGAVVEAENETVAPDLGDVWNRAWTTDAVLPLTGLPVPGTIVVTLGGPPAGPGVTNPGTPLPSQNPDGSANWTYQPATNSVGVNSRVYSLGMQQQVFVGYTLQCD